MRLQQVRCFDAVARHGSARRAAAELFLTAPSVAEQVAGLEAELGVILLERSTRGSRLTAAGDHLLPHLRRLLTAERLAIDEATTLRELRGGTLRVVGVRRAVRYLLPPALGEFALSYPEVHLEVAEAPTDEALTSLADGGHDLAVVGHVGLTPRLPGTLVGETLGTEPVVIAVPVRFVVGEVDGVDWATVPWIVLPPGTAVRTITDRIFGSQDRRIVCEVSDAATARVFVEVGLGASVLPWAFAADLDPAHAIVLPLPSAQDEVGMAVVVDGARSLPPAAAALRTMLLERRPA